MGEERKKGRKDERKHPRSTLLNARTPDYDYDYDYDYDHDRPEP